MKPLTIAKAPKKTYIDQIMVREKKSPGPHTYRPKPQLRKSIISKIPAGRMLQLFDEVKFLSMQSPSCQQYKINPDSVEGKNFGAIFSIVPRDQYKPKKHFCPPTPGVGQYKDAVKPFVEAKDSKPQGQPFRKAKRPSFVDELHKRQKSIPGVGQYKVTEEMTKQVCRHPSAGRQRLG